MRPLDLRRYPDGLQRQRWRSMLLHVLMGAALGAGLCSLLMLWLPTAQDWEVRLAALQAQAQAQVEAQQHRQREKAESQRLQQREARWMQWVTERERLGRLWAVLDGATDVQLQGLELEATRALLQVQVPDERTLDRLLARLAEAGLGPWRVQQQTAAVLPVVAPPTLVAGTSAGLGPAAAAASWGVVLQADWPSGAASTPVVSNVAGVSGRAASPLNGNEGSPSPTGAWR